MAIREPLIYLRLDRLMWVSSYVSEGRILAGPSKNIYETLIPRGQPMKVSLVNLQAVIGLQASKARETFLMKEEIWLWDGGIIGFLWYSLLI